MDGLDRSPQFLKTGITLGLFHTVGKHDSATHLLNNIDKTGESSGEHFLRTMTGILSGPVALDGYNFAMIEATFVGVMRMWLNDFLVLGEKSGIGWPESSRVE